MPPASKSRTYARNGPLLKRRSSPAPQPSSPSPRPATLSSPSSSTRALGRSSSSFSVPTRSSSPSLPSDTAAAAAVVLGPSVALGANALVPAAGDSKAKRRPPGPPSTVQGTLKGFFSALPRPERNRASVLSSLSSASPSVERLHLAERPAKRPRSPGAASSSPSHSSLSTHPTKRASSSSDAAAAAPPPTILHQLLLAPLPSTLQTCPTCQMTFAPSSPVDATQHTAFHRTVERGLAWFRPGETGASKGEGVENVAGGDVEWEAGGGRRGTGRVVRVRGIPPGKVGKKIKELHALLNAHLSAPDLPPGVLAKTQTFLLLSASAPPTPAPKTDTLSTSKRGPATASSSNSGTSGGGNTPGGAREYIIAACVVQRITSALRVLSQDEVRQRAAAAATATAATNEGEGGAGRVRRGEDGGGGGLVCVEPARGAATGGVDGDAAGAAAAADDGGVFCDPTPLPTLLGVHRIQTSSLFRSLSLASHLLSTACTHAIFGVPVGVGQGEGGVAFSQPTRSGRQLMRRWAKGRGGEVRIFLEDVE